MCCVVQTNLKKEKINLNQTESAKCLGKNPYISGLALLQWINIKFKQVRCKKFVTMPILNVGVRTQRTQRKRKLALSLHGCMTGTELKN